jgi:hypothetical protein
MNPPMNPESRQLVARLVDRVMERLDVEPPNFAVEMKNAPAFQETSRKIEEVIGLIVQHVADTADDQNDMARFAIERWLLRQDRSDSSWTQGTTKETPERRALIYQLIGLTLDQQKILSIQFPPFPKIAIGHDDNWIDWWSEERKQADSYYAGSLLAYLRARRGWSEANLAKLDRETDDIVKNVADPLWAAHGVDKPRIYGSRGLVVGYVQSGKTTTMNMTIAKAIDHGYKLIIVLGGLTDLLRRQTQRRLDKEVVGQDFLKNDPDGIAKPDAAGQGGGYLYDKDWSEFIVHPKPLAGKEPRLIERLTTQQFDFSKPRGGVLFGDAYLTDPRLCKIIVIKKNVSRLKTLVHQLQAIPVEHRRRLSALILDDESDQAAAINLVKPDAHGNQALAGVNEQVVGILKLLENVQYVGLTATPAANCFISPKDEWGMYPKDFILVLDRPHGYMGILDFHDIDDVELEPIPPDKPQPKKRQHVRDITSPRGQDDMELQRCLDTFLLAGALKVYRSRNIPGYQAAKHHTLFYSDSVKVQDQKDARDRVRKMWDESAFQTLSGLKRLAAIYESDLLANSPHRNDTNYFPATFDALREDISEAIRRIDEEFDGHEVAITVNGDASGSDPDFQARSIWKIVIGGMKLSRGYTIEGLTITYFRRKNLQASSLMQMGRWFGYRAGYQDLVRLYISRREEAKPAPIDVYDIFESVCIDEENLRRNFKRWYNSIPRVTPEQLRPLIGTCDNRLLPAPKNQMWPVQLVATNFSSYKTDDFTLRDDHLSANVKLWRDLIAGANPESISLSGNQNATFTSQISHSDMVKCLKQIRFSNHNKEDSETLTTAQTNRELFLSFLQDHKRCSVKYWHIIIPQLTAKDGKWTNVSGFQQFSKHERSLRQELAGDHKRLGQVSNGVTRNVAKTFVGCYGPTEARPLQTQDLSRDLQAHIAPALGAVLLYPIKVIGQQHDLPLMGFEIYMCHHPEVLAWGHPQSR